MGAGAVVTDEEFPRPALSGAAAVRGLCMPGVPVSPVATAGRWQQAPAWTGVLQETCLGARGSPPGVGRAAQGKSRA